MFDEEVKSLLEKEWTEEEKLLIQNLISTVVYYKRMLPKTFKQDILSALQMCNSLKIELDLYRKKCKCTFVENDSKETEEQDFTQDSICNCKKKDTDSS